MSEELIDLKKMQPLKTINTREQLEDIIKVSVQRLKPGHKAPVDTKKVNQGTFTVTVYRMVREKKIPKDVHVKVENKTNVFLARY